MSKKTTSRTLSREAAMKVLFAQAFTDGETGATVAGVDLTLMVDAIKDSVTALRETDRATQQALAALEATIKALSKAANANLPVPIPHQSESVLDSRVYLHQARRTAIETMEHTATVLRNGEELFEQNGYTMKVLRQFDQNRAKVESLLEAALEGWSLRRLTAEDGSILRLGITELIYITDTPERVVLDEYIELAKRYGTAESPKLVNGVLDRILRENPREKAAKKV